MPITVISHEVCLEHDPGAGHPERAERLTAAHEGVVLALGDDVHRLTAEPASTDALAAVHRQEMIDHIHAVAGQGGGRIDADTVMSARSLEASLLATGSGLQAIDAIHDSDGVLCAVRPPGHHATPDTSMGFCVFNSAAVTARELARRGTRVAVVDFDAHHGNGTQDVFYADPDVLVVSLHQWPLYPGTGRHDEIGVGAGEGTTVNVPLPAGATGDVYRAAMDQIVLPALQAHGVEQLIISAGFDSHRADPITDLGLTSADHGEITRALVDAAGSPIVFLEGGYDLDAVRHGVAAMLAALAGSVADIEAPTQGGPGREVIDAIASGRPTT